MHHPRVYHLAAAGEPISTDEQSEWYKRCIAMDEAFKEALLAAHPELRTFVDEEPGTELPVAVLR